MDAEISLCDRPQSAFAAQARELSEIPTLEQWLKYWNDADTDFGNLNNIQHWLQRADATQR